MREEERQIDKEREGEEGEQGESRPIRGVFVSGRHVGMWVFNFNVQLLLTLAYTLTDTCNEDRIPLIQCTVWRENENKYFHVAQVRCHNEMRILI